MKTPLSETRGLPPRPTTTQGVSTPAVFRIIHTINLLIAPILINVNTIHAASLYTRTTSLMQIPSPLILTLSLPQAHRQRLRAPQSRAGHGVLAELLVQAEKDTGVLSSVKAGGRDTTGDGRAAASDLEVDALGVGLGAVGVASGVKGDDLVTEDVAARGEVGGNGEVPREAVGDEVVGGPVTGVGARVQASSGDLGELKSRRVRGGKVGDGGEVVNDRAMVRVGPGVPLSLGQSSFDIEALGFTNLEGYGRPSSDSGSVGGRNTGLVASNVRGAKRVGLDEAIVAVAGSPADGIRRGIVGDATRVSGAINNDGGDVAMGLDGRSHGEDRQSRGKHLDEVDLELMKVMVVTNTFNGRSSTSYILDTTSKQG